jgi:hypothetical protein
MLAERDGIVAAGAQRDAGVTLEQAGATYTPDL